MPNAEAYRIAAGMTGTEAVMAVTAASQALIAANAARKQIAFFPPAAGNYTVSQITPAILGQGVNVVAGGVAQVLKVEDLGSWVTGALFVIGSGVFNANKVEVTGQAG